MPALWDKPLAQSSGSSLRDLCDSVFRLSSAPTSLPHGGARPGTSNFLAVGCGLNNFTHGLAYSCRKASMGFIFAARVAG